MSAVLAIDPGCTESAYALIAADTLRPIEVDKLANATLNLRIPRLLDGLPTVAIEMVSSYGMAVGREVFETCVWIGRFAERSESLLCQPTRLVLRRDVKLHHCQSSKAKDANIAQALIDRFASGEPNRGKGTVKAPGWFHGFKADIWQSYALAVYVADTQGATQ
jgi:hypothetical protein